MPGALNRVSVLGSRNIYLLMLGLDNAGKTCAAKSLVGESLDNVAPTIGFSKVSTKYKGFNGIYNVVKKLNWHLKDFRLNHFDVKVITS